MVQSSKLWWLLWLLAVVVAAAVAGAGVAVGLAWPGIETMSLGGALLGTGIAFGSIAVEKAAERFGWHPSWSRRLIHSRAMWAACVVMAVGGHALYLLAMNDRTWWVGGLLVLPLAFLMMGSIEEHRERTGRGPDSVGGDAGGGTAWGPPGAL